MIDEKYMIEFEKEINSTLQENYRNAMLDQNGGKFRVNGSDWNLFPIFDPSDKTGRTNLEGDVLRLTKEYSEMLSYPNGALILGEKNEILFITFPGSDGYYQWDFCELECKFTADSYSEFIPVELTS